MKTFIIIFTFIMILSNTISIKLNTNLKKKKFIPIKPGNEISNDNISESLSSAALHIIYSRANSINETSCRMTAQMVLLAICGVRDMEEISILNLTDNYIENLNNIKEKLLKNYIIQIEIRTNHHFTIFKKNNEEMYLLQGFQDVFNLKEWIADKDIMKPYLTINEFFNKMEIILNPKVNENERINELVNLFYPKIFSNDENKRNKIRNWFERKNIKLIAVNYCSYNFEENEKNHQFNNVLDEVFDTYDIRTWRHFNKDFPDQKYKFQ